MELSNPAIACFLSSKSFAKTNQTDNIALQHNFE